MKSRRLLSFFRASGALQVDSIEYLYQFDNPHDDAGLFQQLPRHALLERLAQLQHPSWDRPLPKQGLTAAPNEHSATLIDNDAPHTDHWTLRILPRRCHLEAIPSFPKVHSRLHTVAMGLTSRRYIIRSTVV